MSDDRRSKIIETVKKLIVHEQSAHAIGSAEEALAFSAKIADLMRQYRIERHEVEPSVIDAMDFRDFGMTYAYGGGDEVPWWQAFVFLVIAEAHGCQCIILGGSDGHFFIAGQTVDRAVAGALSSILVQAIESLCESKLAGAMFSDPAVMFGRVSHEDYRISYRTGFIQALQERLKKDEASAGEEALVLVGRTLQKVERYADMMARSIKRSLEEESL